MTETQSAQIELDKSIDSFKELHHERQNLLSQLEEMNQSLLKRDQSIENMANKIASKRNEEIENAARVKTLQMKMQEEQENNRQLQLEIESLERMSEKKRNELSKYFIFFSK